MKGYSRRESGSYTLLHTLIQLTFKRYSSNFHLYTQCISIIPPLILSHFSQDSPLHLPQKNTMTSLMIQRSFSHCGENSDLERGKTQEADKDFMLYDRHNINLSFLSHRRNNSYHSWFSSSVMDFLCSQYNLVVKTVFFLLDSSF